MSQIITIFNRYYGWCLTFAILYLILGLSGFAVGVSRSSMMNVITAVITYIIPAVLLLVYCHLVRKSRNDHDLEHIEQACRYQKLFIVYLGIITLLTTILMIFGLLAPFLPFILQ